MGLFSVKECKQCGKKGVFLTLYEGGLCGECYVKGLNIEGSKDESVEPQEKGLFDDFVIIDVETTGLDSRKDKIIQIAAVRYVNRQEYGSFMSYVNPGKRIPATVTKINGITNKMVQTAPRFEGIFREYFAFIEQSPLVIGYNVGFDLKFLGTEAGIYLAGKWHHLEQFSEIAIREEIW